MDDRAENKGAHRRRDLSLKDWQYWGLVVLVVGVGAILVIRWPVVGIVATVVGAAAWLLISLSES